VDNLKGSKDQKAVRSAVEAWLHEAIRADWKSPADVLKAYANASIVGPDEWSSTSKGMITGWWWPSTIVTRFVFIKWIGTHGDYEQD